MASSVKTLRPNPGAQEAFVTNTHRYSAFIGGVGSGKTWAGLVRGLMFSQQQRSSGPGPRGLVGAVSYRVLKDVVLPEFFALVEGTGLLKDYVRSDERAVLQGGAEILFRTLEDPNRLRGLQLSWFFIDEARLVGRAVWDILVGRLRQPGYTHAGWVCSTPNGHDWMWELFHEDSPYRHPDAAWYGASTYENRANLPEEYVRDLEASYEGKWFEQEVLGHFVGVVSGAVFPHWDTSRYSVDVTYDPELPLYSMWDFGIGDPGVVLFAQVSWQDKRVGSGIVQVPVLRFHSYIEAQDWSAKDWVEAFREHCRKHFDGRLPDRNIGDPAGRQRNAATGTSALDALAAQGVLVVPAPKRPFDTGVLILDNMMAGGRVLVDRARCSRLAAAFATHHWKLDDNGNKVGTRPIHDWTSHFCDAARYGALVLFSHFPRRRETVAIDEAPPGTVGHVIRQLLQPEERWLGPPRPRIIEWTPTAPIGVSDA